jgi:hypothetical protein
MDDIYDRNDVAIQNGDIIDIHQTVNGENLFIALNIDDRQNPDIRYARCPWLKYEYDARELLDDDVSEEFTISTEIEIVGNIVNVIDSYFGR